MFVTMYHRGAGEPTSAASRRTATPSSLLMISSNRPALSIQRPLKRQATKTTALSNLDTREGLFAEDLDAKVLGVELVYHLLEQVSLGCYRQCVSLC